MLAPGSTTTTSVSSPHKNMQQDWSFLAKDGREREARVRDCVHRLDVDTTGDPALEQVVRNELALFHDLITRCKSQTLDRTQNAQVQGMKRILDQSDQKFHKLIIKRKRIQRTQELFSGAQQRQQDASATDSLMRERQHADESNSLLDSNLDRMANMLTGLREDGGLMRNANSVAGQLGALMPNIGELMTKITSVRYRQNGILAVVIAVCIILILLFLIS